MKPTQRWPEKGDKKALIKRGYVALIEKKSGSPALFQHIWILLRFYEIAVNVLEGTINTYYTVQKIKNEWIEKEQSLL